MHSQRIRLSETSRNSQQCFSHHVLQTLWFQEKLLSVSKGVRMGKGVDAGSWVCIPEAVERPGAPTTAALIHLWFTKMELATERKKKTLFQTSQLAPGVN